MSPSLRVKKGPNQGIVQMPKNIEIGDRILIRQDREFCGEFSGEHATVLAFDGEGVLVKLDGYEYPYLMMRIEDIKLDFRAD